MNSLNKQLRANVIKQLETLAERYPNLRLGQILQNAISGDLYYVDDAALLHALQQLYTTYTQFEAAGVRKEQL